MPSELIKPPSKETLERVRGEFCLNEERVREAVEHLKDWIQLQPHLPKEIGNPHSRARQLSQQHNATIQQRNNIVKYFISFSQKLQRIGFSCIAI
jgi:hypothetical protein